MDGKANADGECASIPRESHRQGHPIGATGIAMLGWCYWQLIGKVPAPLRVANPRTAATFNIGGRYAPPSAPS